MFACMQVNSNLLVEMSVELVNVKQLELVLDMHDCLSSYYIHCLYLLIVACPSLQKLIIKVRINLVSCIYVNC